MMKKFSHHYQMAVPNSYDLLKEFARKNKNNLTPAEEMLWNQLRKNDMGVKFRRQHIIGDYIVDFVCLKKWLVIEVDGKYHDTTEQQESDDIRTEYLAGLGFSVIRFTNEEILNDMDAVLKVIEQYIE